MPLTGDQLLGSNINSTRYPRGNTQMHLALIQGRRDRITELMQHEARMDIPNEDGITATIFAVEYRHRLSEELQETLINYIADQQGPTLLPCRYDFECFMKKGKRYIAEELARSVLCRKKGTVSQDKLDIFAAAIDSFLTTKAAYQMIVQPAIRQQVENALLTVNKGTNFFTRHTRTTFHFKDLLDFSITKTRNSPERFKKKVQGLTDAYEVLKSHHLVALPPTILKPIRITSAPPSIQEEGQPPHIRHVRPREAVTRFLSIALITHVTEYAGNIDKKKRQLMIDIVEGLLRQAPRQTIDILNTNPHYFDKAATILAEEFKEKPQCFPCCRRKAITTFHKPALTSFAAHIKEECSTPQSIIRSAAAQHISLQQLTAFKKLDDLFQGNLPFPCEGPFTSSLVPKKPLSLKSVYKEVRKSGVSAAVFQEAHSALRQICDPEIVRAYPPTAQASAIHGIATCIRTAGTLPEHYHAQHLQVMEKILDVYRKHFSLRHSEQSTQALQDVMAPSSMPHASRSR